VLDKNPTSWIRRELAAETYAAWMDGFMEVQTELEFIGFNSGVFAAGKFQVGHRRNLETVMDSVWPEINSRVRAAIVREKELRREIDSMGWWNSSLSDEER